MIRAWRRIGERPEGVHASSRRLHSRRTRPPTGSSLILYQITIRYGSRFQRYHTFALDAADVREALLGAAERIPPAILPEADLVELRVAVDPEARGRDAPG